MTARKTERQLPNASTAAGLPGDEVRGWLQEEPARPPDFPADCQRFSAYWRAGRHGCSNGCRGKPRRSERERAAAGLLQDSGARGARAIPAPPCRCGL